MLAHLPEHTVPFVRFLALTGWRRGEALGLQWRNVDLQAGVLRIEQTKNNEPRTLPFAALPALDELLKVQRVSAKRIERELRRIVTHVFHNPQGEPLTEAHDAWERARKAANLPGKLLHDLRRTAVRDLERAGVARSVAMKLTGHKTEAVYRRYAIVSEQDLSDGLGKLAVSRAVTEQRRLNSRTIPARFKDDGDAGASGAAT